MPLYYSPTTHGLSSLRPRAREVTTYGRVRLPKAERIARIAQLKPKVLAKLKRKSLSFSHLLSDPSLDAYETELRTVLAELETTLQIVRFTHAGKRFYKGTL